MFDWLYLLKYNSKWIDSFSYISQILSSLFLRFIWKFSKQLFCTVFKVCVIWIFSKIGVWRKRKLSKVLECTLPFHSIEGKHSEPRHNIFGVFVDTFITLPHFWRTCYFMWDDHVHGCIFVISMLLEMITLVMIIILMCLACMPEGIRENFCLG